MTLNRQQKQFIVLGSLLVVLAFTLYQLLISTGTSPGGPLPPASTAAQAGQALDLKDIYLKRNSRRTGGRKEVSLQEVDPSLHLERLTEFDPGEPLNARNMFSVGVPPSEQSITARNPGRNSPAPSDGGGMGAASPNPVPTRPAGPAPVIINLKFYGTKFDLAQKKRQGFFADGDEVYLASEGDLVANRYRVIRVGDSSAEVEEVSSKTRRQISLLTQ